MRRSRDTFETLRRDKPVRRISRPRLHEDGAQPPPSFRDRVYAFLRRVPRGRVVTYGQLALLAGHPRAARQVGWIAHMGAPDLPWQRVVNRFGGMATGYTGGRRGHKLDLEDDGVKVRADFTVDLRRYQWWPATPARLRPGPGRAR
jgi:methylated-DNA-protein-cysteine methyltransferase-like protein